jgi:hypothetical protein
VYILSHRCGNSRFGGQGVKKQESPQISFILTPDGDIDYWTTNDLKLNELWRLHLAEFSWSIEEYHRGLKQCCGAERSQVRPLSSATTLGYPFAPSCVWNYAGISWYEAKLSIVRQAIRSYLASPRYSLNPTA